MSVIFDSFYDHVSSSKEQSTFPSSLNLLPRTSASVFFLRQPLQIVFNILHGNIPVSKEVKRNLKKHVDALVSLVESSVPYKKKKQTLAQEGGGFIQDLLIPVLTSIGPLML